MHWVLLIFLPSTALGALHRFLHVVHISSFIQFYHHVPLSTFHHFKEKCRDLISFISFSTFPAFPIYTLSLHWEPHLDIVIIFASTVKHTLENSRREGKATVYAHVFILFLVSWYFNIPSFATSVSFQGPPLAIPLE